MIHFTVSGDDILISGNAVDNMWGDGGAIGPDVTTAADIFVFAPGNNADLVHDFRQSDHDQIDVSAFGFDDLGDLNISVVSGDTVIVDQRLTDRRHLTLRRHPRCPASTAGPHDQPLQGLLSEHDVWVNAASQRQPV